MRAAGGDGLSLRLLLRCVFDALWFTAQTGLRHDLAHVTPLSELWLGRY
jgi:hypothetical protein